MILLEKKSATFTNPISWDFCNTATSCSVFFESNIATNCSVFLRIILSDKNQICPSTVAEVSYSASPFNWWLVGDKGVRDEQMRGSGWPFFPILNGPSLMSNTRWVLSTNQFTVWDFYY